MTDLHFVRQPRLRAWICVSLAVAFVLSGVSTAHADERSAEDVVTRAAVAAADDPGVALPSSEEPGVAVAGDVSDVEVSIPEDPSAGIVVTGAGSEPISITLPQAAASGPAQLTDSTVSYSGSGASSVPLVTPDGTLQILSVLTDAHAAPDLTYSIESASGGGLRYKEDGGFAVLNASGDEIATAEAPWAKDAKGDSVPTHYVVSGTSVTQIVDTSGLAAEKFPVVADPAITVIRYETVAANVRIAYQQPNFNWQVGGCRIAVANSTCTITGSYSVGSTVNASLGLSKDDVAATLGISATATVSGSIGCTSPKLSAGSTYRAYGMGDYRYFTLQRWRVARAGGNVSRSLISTASNQVAFTPINMIYCTR